jgi:rSAM/selenodomain-associated transferase 1
MRVKSNPASEGRNGESPKVERHVGMFAKFWEPGRVKTRLAKSIGEPSAARLYQQFVLCLVARLQNAGDKRVLAISPPEEIEAFHSIAGTAWALELQAAGDLGERMATYFRGRFAAGATSALLIGSDSPTLPLSIFDEALTCLDQHDVVLGPTADGGYYLVGMSGPHTSLFADIQWSTPAVWEQTRAKTEALQLRCHVLPEWFDVDQLDDLQPLRESLMNCLSTCELSERIHLQELARALAGILQALSDSAGEA